jgi:predicted naringenin-chalcone synthase
VILDEGERIPEACLASRLGPSTAWRMARYEESIAPLSIRACRGALESAGVAPETITHLITISCTGFTAPGFDVRIIKSLGLDYSVQRTHIGFMGCHGALNGLRVARGLAMTAPGCRILLCAAELCSLHFTFGPDADRSIANAIFADGAAALVAENRIEGDGTEQHWDVVASGSVLLPGTEGAMSWRIGDHGFTMTLGTEVPHLIGTHLRPWLESWLAREGLDIESVGSWAIHPGGPKILEAARYALRIPEEALADSREVLASYGNMSSPTILFILQGLIRRGALRPCVAIGFGPGLVVEAALFR